MSNDPDVRCIWDEMNGISQCILTPKIEIEVLQILKNLDASIYSDRIDESLYFIIDKIFSSQTVRDIWSRNKYMFSTKFNVYARRYE